MIFQWKDVSYSQCSRALSTHEVFAVYEGGGTVYVNPALKKRRKKLYSTGAIFLVPDAKKKYTYIGGGEEAITCRAVFHKRTSG